MVEELKGDGELRVSWVELSVQRGRRADEAPGKRVDRGRSL